MQTISFAENPLSKRLSVKLENETTEKALEKIQNLGGFYFSFNSKLVDVNKRITYISYREKVVDILNNILGEKFEFKHRGNYVIIQKVKPVLVKKKKVVFKGKISNSKDSTNISGVTIYEIDDFKSTSTDNNGNFDLVITTKREESKVLIVKEFYKDTIISSSELTDSNLNIYLRPLINIDTIRIKNLFKLDSSSWLKIFYNKNIQNALKNVNLSENKVFQFSVVPFIGTNGKLSGKVTNKVSINLLGGYAYGLNGAEFGGIFNILKDTMRGAQFAGVGNVVGGKSKGFQSAGVFNINYDDVVGVQSAGVFNSTTRTLEGAQFAGVYNTAKKIENGAQFSGVFNTTKNIGNGVQFGGLFNTSKNIEKGVQIGGLFNTAKKIERGMQIAGLFNYAKTINGFQLGVFNLTDSIENGIPIGFLSFVKSGFHKTEISYQDYLSGGISFRTGVHSFYNIFAFNYYDQGSDPLLSYGYGLGTQFNFNTRFFSNLELSVHNLVAKNNFKSSFDELNLLTKLNLNVGFNLGKYFSVLAGPELNLLISDKTSSISKFDNFSKRKSIFYEKDNQTEMNMTLGYRVAIRF